ncbi:MAG: hypothetical protein FJ304_11440 [Planctomycetes bacterium]|nr:hypothetical protein [Planctomycetota bacterium]
MRSAWRTVPGVAAVALCAALFGCGTKPTPQPHGGGSTNSKAEKARKDAEQLALSGVGGGATAHAKAEPSVAVRRDTGFNVALRPNPPGGAVKGTAPAVTAPPVAPAPAPVAKGPTSVPRPGWLVHEHIVSTIPYATEAEADEDAVAQARELVEKKLSELDPPLKHKPSLAEVRTEFVRKDSRRVRHPDAAEKEAFAQYGVTGNLVYVEYDVEVTAEQVRELRAQGRVSAGLRVMGALVAVALAGFLFLRADEWTKGYLTSWLALGAIALAAGAAAAVILV